MLISTYALVALLSTVIATPTPSRELKQASRAEVVRRIKRGVQPRAPLPSGSGGAPDTVITSQMQGKDVATFKRFYTGSGFILNDRPSGDDSSSPSMYATYSNSVSSADAAQRCVDLAWSQGTFGGEYYSAAFYFDESDDQWHCRVTFSENSAGDFNAPNANAKPVYGFNRAPTDT